MQSVKVDFTSFQIFLLRIYIIFYISILHIYLSKFWQNFLSRKIVKIDAIIKFYLPKRGLSWWSDDWIYLLREPKMKKIGDLLYKFFAL